MLCQKLQEGINLQFWSRHAHFGIVQVTFLLHGMGKLRPKFHEHQSINGHADLNRHLCIMGIQQDSGCPLCQEEDDTTVHLIAQCSALMLLRKEILGDFTLPLDTLSDFHFFHFIMQ